MVGVKEVICSNTNAGNDQGRVYGEGFDAIEAEEPIKLRFFNEEGI